MNTKSFFGQEGLTSTSANHIANLCKEVVRRLQSQLQSLRFYDEYIESLNSDKKMLVSRGQTSETLNKVETIVNYIGQVHGLIAFLREGIKEKERLGAEAASWCDAEARAALDEDIRLHEANRPKLGEVLSEQDILESWSIGEQERYLSLEAKAAALGKLIHEDGSLSTARIRLMTVINNPALAEGKGAETTVHTYEPTVDLDEVDSTFKHLQAEFRKTQAELNGMKEQIAQAIRDSKREADNAYAREKSLWDSQAQELSARQNRIVEYEVQMRNQKAEEVKALKIVVPNRLKEIYEQVQKVNL